jgi:Tfp pilus assembly protein PilZ
MGTRRADESSRAAVGVALKLRTPDGRRLEPGGIWNISLGGVFVEMREPLPFGEEVGVEFDLEGRTKPVQCSGFVVWSTRDTPAKAEGRSGMALRLTNLGIADMRAIAACVGRELGT